MYCPTTLLLSPRGLVAAGDVRQGDLLVNSQGALVTVDRVTEPKVDRRFYVETHDFRSVVVHPKLPWPTESTTMTNPHRTFGLEGRSPVYHTDELPFKERSNPKLNHNRFVPVVEDHWVDPEASVTGDAYLRAVCEYMGQPEFLEIDGDWVDRLRQVTTVETADEWYWYRFEPTFDYVPWRVHPEVFDAPLDYRLRYLEALWWLGGEFKVKGGVYLAHPSSEYVEDLRRLMWSIGGVGPTPTYVHVSKKAKAIHRIKTKQMHFLGVRTRYLTHIVPGSPFYADKRFIMNFHEIKELDEGLIVSIIPEKTCRLVTHQFLPLFAPSWK